MLQISFLNSLLLKKTHLKPSSLAWSHGHPRRGRTLGLQSHHIQFLNETRLTLQSCLLTLVRYIPLLAGFRAGRASALVALCLCPVPRAPCPVPCAPCRDTAGGMPFVLPRDPRILPAVSQFSSRCPQRPLNPGNGSAPSKVKGTQSSLISLLEVT